MAYEYAKQELQCSSCSKRLNASHIIDSAESSCSVPLSLLYCKCKHRGAKLEAKAELERVSIGYIDGFPGPCFVCQSTEAVPNFVVVELEEGLQLCPPDQRRLVPRYVQPVEPEAAPSPWFPRLRRFFDDWL